VTVEMRQTGMSEGKKACSAILKWVCNESDREPRLKHYPTAYCRLSMLLLRALRSRIWEGEWSTIKSRPAQIGCGPIFTQADLEVLRISVTC